MGPICSFIVFLLLLFHSLGDQQSQQRLFRVSESLASGQRIGSVRGGEDDGFDEMAATAHNEHEQAREQQQQQSFFIVFPPDGNSTAEKLLRVDDRSGEIWLREGQRLDHERESGLHFLAIPVDGSEPISVQVEVLDENDNAPAFPVDSVRLELSEYARINTELTLPMASDPDSTRLGVQRYRIASGNVNNAFRLTYAPGQYLDLVVNGQLDREHRARYELLVEAMDGGKPARTGKLSVQVDILDANDNAPEFLQAHYSARVSPGITLPGIPILRVAAQDPDEGPNGQISYAIASQTIVGPPASSPPSLPANPFQIDSKSGTIFLRHPLPQRLAGNVAFELVIAARDSGIPEPLESSVTVKVLVEVATPRSDGQPAARHRFGLIWLTEDGTGQNVPEGLPLGQPLARVSVEGGDDVDRAELKLSLLGGQSAVCLRQTDSGQIYLLVVCGPLDREKMQALQMDLLLRNGSGGADAVILDHPLRIGLRDVNDNAPRWNSSQFHFEWALGNAEANAAVRLLAQDADAGQNGRLRYHLLDSGDGVGASLFGIDPETGQLWAREEKLMVVCEGVKVHFLVRAEDQGKPPLSADTNVSVLFVRSPDDQQHSRRRIRFGKPLYELALPENTRPSSCILQLSAVDEDAFCAGGSNASSSREGTSPSHNLRFWLAPGLGSELFSLEPTSGLLCTKEWLDFEMLGPSIQLRAMVANRAGDEASAQLLLQLQDVNDNAPVFQPREYALLLSPGGLEPARTLLQVRAVDLDASANFSAVSYALGEGAAAELFHLDAETGTLSLSELGARKLGGDGGGGGQLGWSGLELRVEARDAEGRISEQMALIRVRLLPAEFHCMGFSERVYRFRVAEDTLPGIAVGELRVLDVADPELVRFEIVDDPPEEKEAKRFPMMAQAQQLFAFDPARPNRLLLEGELDADMPGQQAFLLNVKAVDSVNNCTNFTQVLVVVTDANDNWPQFQTAEKVHLEVAEDQPIHEPFFVLQARDRDTGQNGRISYELLATRPANGKSNSGGNSGGSLLPILVHPQSGAISLSAPLDADGTTGTRNGSSGGGGDTYSLVIRAQDQGIPPRQAQLELLLRVLDVNDNAPQFGQPEFSLEVPESAEPMRVLMRAEATDGDRSSANRRLRYRLAQLSPLLEGSEPVLGVNSRTGDIFLRHYLDREQFAEYAFELTAQDGGQPPRNGSARIRLRVLDVNDNAPNCSAGGPSQFSLRPGQEAGTRIGQMQATDPDQGTAGVVRFRLQQPNELVQLSANGELLMRRRLDDRALAELDPSQLSFGVIAEDQSPDGAALSTICQVQLRLPLSADGKSGIGHSAPSNANIETGDIHVIGPVQRDIWLLPDWPTGTQVAQVNATGVAKWSLEPSAAAQFFAISPEGIIRLTKSPSEAMGKGSAWFPSLDGSRLTVRMESSAASSSKFLTFRLRLGQPPAADDGPKASRRPTPLISVPANWTLRAQKPLIQVGGNQSGLAMFFRLEGTDDRAEKMVDEGMFELDELTGALFLADWPPPSLAPVEAANDSIPAATEEADAPPISLRISAHPREDGSNVEQPAEAWLVDLRLDELANRRAQLLLGRPKCVPLFESWNVSEAAPIGTFVGTIDANISSGKLYYELTDDGGEQQPLFRVESATGKVFTTRPLIGQQLREHILLFRLRTVSSSNLASTKCVRQLRIIADPKTTRPPRFLSQPNGTLLLANLERGLYTPDNVFHRFVVHADGNAVEFTLVAGNEAGWFQLGARSGALSLPDPELLPATLPASLRLTIQASPSGSNLSAEQNFLLRLERPHSSRRFVFFEHPKSEAKLQLLDGSDEMPSGGSQFVAKFRPKDGPWGSQTDKNANSAGMAEPAELLLLPQLEGFSLDQETGSLLYRPTSTGTPKLGRGNITLAVIAVPRNSNNSADQSGPLFDHTQLRILAQPESAKKGPKIEPTSCGNLSVPEGLAIPDLLRVRLLQPPGRGGAWEAVVFAIESGNWNAQFSMDPKSGWLSCGPLDREIRAEHVLMVSATDLASQPRKAEVCSVRVLVLDGNDNAPRLVRVPDRVQLPADARIGQVLAKLAAQDADQGPNGRVDFQLERDPSGMFDLDPESGELRFARESAALAEESGVWLSVRAMDRGRSAALSSEPARFRVEWNQRQLKSPTGPVLAFSRAKYVAAVGEGLAPGQPVTHQLELLNRASVPGPVLFSILSGNLDAAFHLDPHTGQLRTALELDAEIRSAYSLHIGATAAGSRAYRAECRVDIRVLDRDDNAPAIRHVGELRLSEDTAVGSLLASLSANDVDAVSTSLEYSLLDESTADGHFEIGRWTGRLHLAKPLDYETQRRHQLRVQAFDGTNRAVANLTVEVLDENDRGPVFGRPFVRVHLPSNGNPMAAGTLLAQLKATDEDGSARNRRISYELMLPAGEQANRAKEWFALDRNTGELRLRKMLPTGADLLRRLGSGNPLFLTVKAIDSGRPPMSDYCTLAFVVESAEDAATAVEHILAPSFAIPIFTFSVPEQHPAHLPIGELTLQQQLPPNSAVINCDFQLLAPINGNASLATLFSVDFQGVIFLEQSLDRERLGEWIQLEAVVSRCPPSANGYQSHLSEASVVEQSSRATVRIQVLDLNEHAPRFDERTDEPILVSERMKPGRLLARLHATDEDDDAAECQLNYTILAGDDSNLLALDSKSGELRLERWDDELLLGEMAALKGRKDEGENSPKESENEKVPKEKISKEEEAILLLVAAHDCGHPRRVGLTKLRWTLEPTSRAALLGPSFAMPLLRKFVEEDTRPGSVLFTVRAVGDGRGPKQQHGWRYSIEAAAADTVVNDTFSVDPTTGKVVLTAPLDLDAKNGSVNTFALPQPARLNVTVKDGEGREARVPVEIYVLGVDEHAPVFAKSTYTFRLSSAPPLGQPVGQVLAEDPDVGIGSRVRYLLDPDDLTAAQFTELDTNSGLLRLIKLPTAKEGHGNGTEEPTVLRLNVWAESGWAEADRRRGPPRRSSASVYIEIGSAPPQSPAEDNGAGDQPTPSIVNFPQHYWLPFLLLPFLLLLLCCLLALVLAKLFLRVRRLPAKSAHQRSSTANEDGSFLRPTPKKRVFTVANFRKAQLEQQQMQRAGGGRVMEAVAVLSPSFESGQFSQHRQAQGQIGSSADWANSPLPLPPPPTSSREALNYMNMPPPPWRPPLLCSDSRRSQPDSGIDPDRTSMMAEEAENSGGSSRTTTALADHFLRQLGVQDGQQRGGIANQQQQAEEEEDSEAAFLDELIYAPLEEIFAQPERKETTTTAPWMPASEIEADQQRLEETMMVFKPLGQVLEEMRRLEREAAGSRV